MDIKKTEEYKIGYEAGAKEMYKHIYEYMKIQYKGESILLSHLASAYLEFKSEMKEEN